MLCNLYWLYDKRCVDPWRHGYIGVSRYIKIRIARHRRYSAFPKNWKLKILFQGTVEECRKLEREMRPQEYIGWNRCIGGGFGRKTNRGRIGQKKSDEECAKISASKKGIVFTAEHRAKLAAAKMGNQNRLGAKLSEKSREQISLKKRGISIHSDEFRRKMSERLKGNTFTKGKPWSVARREAWLRTQEA